MLAKPGRWKETGTETFLGHQILCGVSFQSWGKMLFVKHYLPGLDYKLFHEKDMGMLLGMLCGVTGPRFTHLWNGSSDSGSVDGAESIQVLRTT